MKFVPGCVCCAPTTCGAVCVLLTSSCGLSIVAVGVDAAVSLAGTPIGTCTTTGQVVSVSRTATGSGYTSPPTVSFSGGGGTGAAATAAVSGGLLTTITVTAGGSGYTSAPTVSFSGGGGTGAAANASVQGECCVPITTGGNYSITVSGGHYGTQTGTLFLGSCTTGYKTFTVTPSEVVVRIFSFRGCDSGATPLPGTAITLKESGVTVATGTTNSSGYVDLTVPPSASMTVTGSHSRFADVTDSMSVAGCASSGTPGINAIHTLTTSATITNFPAATTASGGGDYVCVGGSCLLPAPTTLHMNSAVFGAVTLTYTLITPPSTYAWYGTKSVTIDVRSSFAPSLNTIRGDTSCNSTWAGTLKFFLWNSGPDAGTFQIQLQNNTSGQCLDGTGYSWTPGLVSCPTALVLGVTVTNGTVLQNYNYIYNVGPGDFHTIDTITISE